MGEVQSIEDHLAAPILPELAAHADWVLGSMVGRSPAMQRLFSQMRFTAQHLRVAAIEGESGTGKTLAARTLHTLGPASAAYFVLCPATKFFEQVQSASKEARGGTLFLTHIEELSLEQQGLLLEFLQWLDHQHARRSGDSLPRQILVSSNQPLRRLAATPALRADLCHRLTAMRFAIPALRERREDIPILAEQFAFCFSAVHGKPIRGLGPQTLPRLLSHTWPGNVRELESAIHNAALDCPGQWIRPVDIPSFASPAPNRPANAEAAQEDDPNLDRAILRHITRVLAQAEGNKLRAARMLGISRSTLYRLLESGSENTESAPKKNAMTLSPSAPFDGVPIE